MNEELEATAEVQGNPPDEEQTAHEEKIAELTKTAREQMAKKNWEDALKTYAQVLTLQQQAEDRVGIAKVKNDMASVYLAQREWQQALDLLEHSREIFTTAGDP
ncbi:MAG: tetratricopeptide repeat protein, partial [Anaerolineae bacterium]|nr:tetratricopeptide repeat protein [Anaerolineae bacterium]